MKKGLGRGFDSLIPTNLIDETFDPTATQDDKVSQLVQLSVTKIVADPDQPRRYFEEEALKELAASIREHGVVQPLVVTPVGDAFSIVAGERRWRAAQLAGLKEVPALVRTISGQHRLEISLIENLQRRDLNAIETATAYAKLRDQFNLTLEQIGERVGGKSVSTISNTMRLLKLPKSVQDAVFQGMLSEGQARTLVGLEDAVAETMMKRAIDGSWSTRRLEQAIASMKQTVSTAATKEPFSELSKSLGQRFQVPVRIRSSAKGTGHIVIPFKNHAELERIQKLLS